MADVTVYSANWCAFCHMAKQYLTQKGVKFEVKDVESDLEALNYIVDKTGQRGIPVLDIGGNIVIGFDRPKIDQLLKEKHLI